MITNLLIGSGLVAITVIIHAMGLGMVLSHVLHSSARPDTRFWPIAWLLTRIAWFLIVIHFIEIAVWALFFWWYKWLPDAESVALFFRCYLRHDRLRGYRAAKRMATIRAGGGIDWHSNVRLVHRAFLRCDQQKNLAAHGRAGNRSHRMSMRPDLPAASNQAPQEKKKWVEPVAALLMALATLQHRVVLVRVSRVDSKKQSADE